MGSNVQGYGGFDDIVFVYRTPDNIKYGLFLQMKNKANSKIRLPNLVSETHDFSLKKLYDSYVKIEEIFKSSDKPFAIDIKFENCIFVLYTNADVDCKSLKINGNVDLGPEEIIMTQGSMLHLNDRDHMDVYQQMIKLPKLKDFLNKFKIIYNQASENELNSIISNEIDKNLKLSDGERESAFHKFQEMIQDWWKKTESCFYLTDSYGEHNPLRKTSEFIEYMRLKNLMKERRSEIAKLGLTFCENVLKEMEEVIGKKKVTLITSPQSSMKITCAKVHQLMNDVDYGVLRFEDFKEHKSITWSNYKFKYLVMQLDKSIQQFDTMFLSLSRIVFKESQDTKVILIMNENIEDPVLLEKYFPNELEIYEDNLTYDMLSKETMMVLLRKNILFQGYELELNKIGIKTLDFLDQTSMSLLLQEEKPEIGQKPPDPIDFYIHRTLKYHKDLVQDTRKLKRVHSLTWKPENVLDGNDRVIIITSEPGMGKSTLLTHLFRTTKEHHPEKWIVRININDFTKMLDEFKKNDVKGGNAALRLLESVAGSNNKHSISAFEKKLLYYSYNVSGNLTVLVDGMDEISPDYCQEAFQILNELNQSKVEKIWVTSRPHLKCQLEHLLKVKSYLLVPFDKEDQTYFLQNYWMSKVPSLDEGTLAVFVKRVLEISKKFQSENQVDFMGLPLQILFLAEMYLEELQLSNPTEQIILTQDINIIILYKKYIDKKWKICNEEKLKTDLTKVQAIKHDAILKKEFIKNNMFAAILTLFSKQELQLINDENVKSEGEEYLKEVEEDGDKTGLIVKALEGKAQFVHRTMAEYFAAKWIFEHLEGSKCLLKRYIFKPKHTVIRKLLDCFVLEGNPLQMSVLNRNLTENSELLQRVDLMNKADRLGRTALHIAVMYELPNETKTLLRHGADINVRDKLQEWTPVEYAEKLCTLNAEILDGSLLGAISINNKLVNAEIMDARPETIKVWSTKKRPNMCDESYLHIAAKHSLLNLLNHFVKNIHNINGKVHGGHRLLLHHLAFYGQVETIEVMLKLGADCNILDEYRNTALHIAVGRNHKNVAALLIDSGVNVNCRNVSGCTPLHLAVTLYKHDIAELLVRKGADIHSIDDYDYTPLSIANSHKDMTMINLLLGTDTVTIVSD